MVELSFKLNGQPADTPRNYEEIKLISNWSPNSIGDNSEAEISTNVLQLVLNDVNKITNHIQGGLTGGVGIFEGMPYEIATTDLTTGVQQQILDGFIDLADNALFTSCDEAEVVAKKKFDLDWFTQAADSFSFAYLESIGTIKESDYVDIPYLLNFRPDEATLATSSIALFLALKSTQDALLAIEKSIEALIEVGDAIPGTNFGDIAASIVAVVSAIAYAVIIAIAIVNLLNDIIEQLYPAIRYHRGIKVKTLFEKGCQFLGLAFESTIFKAGKYKDLVIMPTKDEKGVKTASKSKELGIPTSQSSVYNFGDFIRTMKQAFNAKIKIANGELVFERRDYWDQKANYVLPDVETDQDIRLSQFRYNTDEFISNFILSYSTDIQDENTLEDFKGTNVQIISRPNTYTTVGTVSTPLGSVDIPSPFINMKGFGEVRLPFARATRKDSLTLLEKTIGLFIDPIKDIIKYASGNKVVLPKSIDRIGCLNLTAHTTSVDKLLLLDGNKLDKNQIEAVEFWADFHLIDSFAEVTDPLTGLTYHNQHKVYENVEIPFCNDDWNKLLTNNKFNTSDGRIGEMLTLEWDIHNEKALVTYKIKELYTKNINLVINEGA